MLGISKLLERFSEMGELGRDVTIGGGANATRSALATVCLAQHVPGFSEILIMLLIDAKRG